MSWEAVRNILCAMKVPLYRLRIKFLVFYVLCRIYLSVASELRTRTIEHKSHHKFCYQFKSSYLFHFIEFRTRVSFVGKVIKFWFPPWALMPWWSLVLRSFTKLRTDFSDNYGHSRVTHFFHASKLFLGVEHALTSSFDHLAWPSGVRSGDAEGNSVGAIMVGVFSAISLMSL